MIETILANKFPDLTTEMIMQLLDLKQTDITQSLFYQEIKQEGHQEEAAALLDFTEMADLESHLAGLG